MLNYSNSKVTMELRDVLATKDENGNPFNLWDFDYPSYYKDEAKTAFEQKVIDHFLFHQIGVETIGRFKHNFKTRIREIMPYYIQMYKSVEIMDKIEDPFGNVDVTEIYKQKTKNTVDGTVINTNDVDTTLTETVDKTDTRTPDETKEHRFSNTPQGSLDTLDNYLTEGSIDTVKGTEKIDYKGTNTTANKGIVKNTDKNDTITSGDNEYTLTRRGNQGVNTYAHDMIEFRQSFINVDMMIIGELRDLFLLIY